MKRSIIVVLFLAIFFTSMPAQAKGRGLPIPFLIGSVENLHPLSEDKLEFPDGEKVTLGYKTKGWYLFKIVGIYVSNQGYALIPEFDDNSYYELDDASKAYFTMTEQLPEDLPEQPKMGIKTMLQGYLLWILLAVFGLFLLFTRRSD